MNQSFSKIWIIVIIAVFVAGGIFARRFFQYFQLPKEGIQIMQEKTVSQEEKLPHFEDFPVSEKFEGPAGKTG